MPRNTMTFDFGLGNRDTSHKRKFRWIFSIPGVVADTTNATYALPPLKGARPDLTFKEMEVQHLTETVYYPQKPEWRPIPLVLYDIRCNANPVFDWIKKVYESSNAKWYPVVNGADTGSAVTGNFKKTCTLELFDGCGNCEEKWVFENAYPQEVNWGELDMSSSDVVTVDISLRYDRAYFDFC